MNSTRNFHRKVVGQDTPRILGLVKDTRGERALFPAKTSFECSTRTVVSMRATLHM